MTLIEDIQDQIKDQSEADGLCVELSRRDWDRIVAALEPRPEDGVLNLLRRAHTEIRRWKSCQSIGACRNCADDGFLLQLGLYLEQHRSTAAKRSEDE